MDLGLKGSSALVTGSTAGIGFAVAGKLAAEGCSVYLNGRSPERVAEAREKLLKEQPDADLRAAAGDLSTDAGTAAVLEAAPEVDIVVHNAATYGSPPFFEIEDEEWRRKFETNVMSGVRLARHHLKLMLARNSGRIVFLGSDLSVTSSPFALDYAVTKAAGLSLSRGLAEQTRGTAVTVNTVLAGATETEGFHRLATESGLAYDQFESMILNEVVPASLVQRVARPQEVASTVAFIASPLASLTNGAAVRCEGGAVRSFG
ncbi:SDR family NAD(P)-dependent oxidoreductase [Amycolatopsis pithecellobii]|uniref:SDR family oxidoreductase n=1 Tax=Amycolatopsis pithecellobii TaxID=664692 RepID=A0A6N7Z5Y6_9PSEU|nr:SDR family oxidoreductase [Amycolatopsis pithecellobii]MTD56060.1 SDR family oxidoreductase [Amycolatopsis pithecellobii]